MSLLYLLSGLVVVLLFAYLCLALLKPEMFQ
jgi:K+-transporting ATPase KdpF subunit